jgi:vancomycin resistance protein YoaR
MITRTALVTTFAALLACAVGSASFGSGAAHATPQNPAAQAAPQPQSGMADMMKMHEQMMAEMKAADAKLDALVKEMNAASGDAKVNATAAVVTELVRQQKSMHAHMGQMHQQMMGRGTMMGR